MLRLVRNLVSWFVYTIISGFLLYAPLSDIGMRIISMICAALLIGFFAGLFNDIIRQLMIINNYADYKHGGGHMMNTEHVFKQKIHKTLNFLQCTRVLFWILFNQKRKKHFVFCMVAHNHKPLESYKETMFVDDSIIKDRSQRRHIDDLKHKKFNMKYWHYHSASDTYFLEVEDYQNSDGEDVVKLKYDESIDELTIEKLHRRDSLKNNFSITDGEVVKPKITNWANILNKVRNVYDSSDLKVKHATDEYVNLPQSPEADDLLHHIFSKKKSLFTLQELIELFGQHRRELIENSLSWLIDKGILLGYSFQDDNILKDWNYAETDKFSINVNYNGQ